MLQDFATCLLLKTMFINVVSGQTHFFEKTQCFECDQKHPRRCISPQELIGVDVPDGIEVGMVKLRVAA
jgi:hypothetical protein